MLLRSRAALLVLVLLAAAAVAAPPPRFDCPAVPLPEDAEGVAHCDAACQQDTGNALLQLYAGLAGESSHPLGGRVWRDVSASAACDSPCSLLPSYCSWLGVFCCFSGTDTAPGSGCRLSSSTQGQCGSAGEDAAHGSVWLVDITQWGLAGQLSDGVLDALEVLTANGLHALDLSSNTISGRIPARVGRLGANLTTLNLNFNQLTGSIPPAISQLPNLKRLFMSFNRLSGTLDGCFCTKPNSTLEVLILRANGLEGSAEFRNCSRLLLLDLTDNFLTGTVPIGITNSALISLRATNNKFTSSIPDAVWKLPVLTTIDLGNNDITGSISPFCGSSFNLVNVLLGNNSLTGTIPPNLTTNSQLLTLELHNNTGLYGTFPNSRSLVGLRKLDLHNTSLQGRIPDEWGTLPYLEYVDITGTRMTCCGSQAEADDPNFPKLPRFLTFTKQYAQFDLNRAMHMTVTAADEVERTQPNNILCRTVRRQPLPEQDWNKHGLPVTSDAINAQKWLVSPLYAWFDECTCTKFHHMQSGRYAYQGIHDWCSDNASAALGVPAGPCLDMQIFLCADDTPLQPQQKAAIVVGVVLFTLLLIALLIYASLAKASKLRRSLMLAALRLKGVPKSGRMTLVVTDIEGYSDIFRRSPEVMFAALVKHNSVLRAAKFSNGGFVLEQEGDSFTVAFYDPFDAVVFCLQAQQALLAVNWPPGLDDDSGLPQSDVSISSRKHSKLHTRLSPLLAFGPKLKRTNTNTRSAAGSMVMEPWPSSAQHMLAALGSRISPMDTSAVLFNGLRVRMGVVTGEVPSGTPIKNSSLFQLAKVVGDFGQGGQIILDDATFAAIKEDVGALGCVEAGGINHHKLSSGRSCWTGLLRLCGCARQRVAPEEAVVLDMGAFCYMPGAEEDAELPYTTSRPLDVKQPEQPDGDAAPAAAAVSAGAERSLWQRLRAHSGCSGGAGQDGADTPSPGSSPRGPHSSLPPAAQLSRRFAASAVSSMARSSGAASGSLRQVSSDNERDAVPGGVGRLVSFSARATRQWADLRKTLARSASLQQPGSRRDWESVRVYQILAPRLSGRAHAWHNAMNVKQGWVQWDNAYFEAPGTTTAPLTGGGLDVLSSSNSRTLSHTGSPQQPGSGSAAPDTSQHPPAACGGSSASQLNLAVLTGSASLALPPVTMVFMCADNPAELVRRRRPFTPQVQTLLSRVVRDALRRLGGYLCRVQEGDLKYMVAFSSPVTALEWCLTVQVAAMYLPWPRSAIMLLPSCREQVDASGRLVFRGPRLKMGVCEGLPKSILPDHEGRADYHGQSINMAARFMDKGAAGGQIACTRELAVKAMAAWAARGSGAADAGGALRSYSSVTGVRPGGGSKLEHSIAEDDSGCDVTVGGAATEPPPSAAAGPASPWQVPAPASSSTQPLDIDDAAAGDNSGSGAGLLAKALRQNSSAGSKARPWWSGCSSHPGAAAAAAPSLISSLGSGLAEPWFSTGSADFARQPSSTAGSGTSQPAPAAAAAGNDGSGSSGGAPGSASRGRPGGGSSWPGSDGCALPSRKQHSHALKQQLSRARSSTPATPSITFQGRSAALQRLAGQLSQPQPSVPLVPPVAPSAFVLQHVPLAPMALEVRRLGLFSFKGGPPQQEMVQVLPSHLVGRLAVDEAAAAAAAAAGAAAAPPPASRKGQLLQRLEGRVGEPVSIQLPALAQEYHARLPDRLSGLTGLPHVDLTASSQRTGGAAAAAAVGAHQAGHLPSVRTAALPGRQGGVWPAVLEDAPGAAAGGQLHDQQQHSGAAVGGAGAAAAAAGAVAWSSSAPLPSVAPLACHPLGARSSSSSSGVVGGPGHVSIVVADADKDGVPSALASFSSKQLPPAAGAGAGEECNGGGGSGSLTRHDSFQSVDGAAVAAADSDEEMGLVSPTSLRAKSDPPRMMQG